MICAQCFNLKGDRISGYYCKYKQLVFPTDLTCAKFTQTVKHENKSMNYSYVLCSNCGSLTDMNSLRSCTCPVCGVKLDLGIVEQLRIKTNNMNKYHL